MGQFWVSGKESADLLAAALGRLGFRVKVNKQSVTVDQELPRNLEVAINQSIDLTLRHELTNELVRIAARFNGRYDGWGTAI